MKIKILLIAGGALLASGCSSTGSSGSAIIPNKAIQLTAKTSISLANLATTALVANLTCFSLLMRFRDQDINLRSVWLCSRNDVFSNAGVIAAAAAAAGAAAGRGQGWPDLLIGALVALLFLHTSYDVLRAAIGQLRL